MNDVDTQRPARVFLSFSKSDESRIYPRRSINRGLRDGISSATRMKRGAIKDASPNPQLPEQALFIKSYAGLYYDPKDPSNLKFFKERQLFLRIAALTVPDFAQSFFDVTCRLTRDWIQSDGSLPPPTSPAYTEYWSQLLGSISNWARRFNIETDWVYAVPPAALQVKHPDAILAARDERTLELLCFPRRLRRVFLFHYLLGDHHDSIHDVSKCYTLFSATERAAVQKLASCRPIGWRSLAET